MMCFPCVIKLKASRASERAACGRAELTVRAVPTPTPFPFLLLHTLHPLVAVPWRVRVVVAKKGWQLLSVHLDGVPQALSFGNGDSVINRHILQLKFISSQSTENNKGVFYM